MNYLPYTLTEENLSVMVDGNMKVLPASHANYEKAKQAIINGDWDLVPDLMDITIAVNKFGAGKVVVTDGMIMYNGQELHNALTVRIMQMMSEGFDITPMVNFLENLLENPSHRAVNELYGFMDRCSLPITEDGHLLAYKIVRGNYTDTWTGKFDNSVGTIVEMPRNEVSDNKDDTCSSGLHFCSQEYLPYYGVGGDRKVVIVKVNPRDVVSIPSDCSQAKARACRYEVISDHLGGEESAFDKSVYDKDGDPYNYDEDDYDEDDYDGYDYDTEEPVAPAANARVTVPAADAVAAKYSKDSNGWYCYVSLADAAIMLGKSKNVVRQMAKFGQDVEWMPGNAGMLKVRDPNHTQNTNWYKGHQIKDGWVQSVKMETAANWLGITTRNARRRSSTGSTIRLHNSWISVSIVDVWHEILP